MEHYFISDLHFNHDAAATFRHFKDTDEMNRFLIKRLANIVRTSLDKEIKLYHVGDFAFKDNKLYWKNYLPSNTIFIRGNHDSISISHIEAQIISWNGYKVEIVHNPRDATETTPIVIHGHIHKTGNRTYAEGTQSFEKFPYIHKRNNTYYYNVCCEFHKFKPKLLNEIVGELKQVGLK